MPAYGVHRVAADGQGGGDRGGRPTRTRTASIQLSYEEFEAGVQRLLDVGFEIERSAEEAWPHFRGWRVNYEPIAYALAYRLDAVPALWSGPAGSLRNRCRRSARPTVNPAVRSPRCNQPPAN